MDDDRKIFRFAVQLRHVVEHFSWSGSPAVDGYSRPQFRTMNHSEKTETSDPNFGFCVTSGGPFW